MSTARVLPQNIEAEECVLSAMLYNAPSIETAMEVLRFEHFYRRSYGRIFEAICSLRQRNLVIDPVTVADELEAIAARLEDEGTKPEAAEARLAADGLLSLARLPASISGCRQHALLVRASWAKRSAIALLSEPMRGLWNGVPAETALRRVESACIALGGLLQSDESELLVDAFSAAQEFEAKTRNPPDPSQGIAPPFKFLSRLRAGRLYVLGGYPADGKTALAVQFLRAAASGGKRVGFASLEMSWRDLTDRIVASFGVPYHQAMSGVIAPPHQHAVNKALAEIARWQVDIIDDEELDAIALHRYQRLGKYDLLIIDHLHCFKWADRREIEQAIRSIRNIARAFEIPVLLLCQLRRPMHSDGFPRPTLHSLRETAMLEAEAAVVWFIWRERDSDNNPTSQAKLIVAKNRFGPIGDRPLQFRPEECRYVEVDSHA